MAREFISLNEKTGNLKEKLQKVYGHNFDLEYEVLELFYDQFNMFAWIIRAEFYEDKAADLLGSVIIKSWHSLFSSLKLEIEGHLGSSRILMRHAYEYLIIGKYYSITNNDSLLQQFRKELDNTKNDISVRKLLKSLNNIDPQLMLKFWSDLCEFSHATISSQSIGFSNEDNKIQHELNQRFIVILLNMMYHFMHSHFVNHNIKNAYNRIDEMEEWNKYKLMRDRQKEIIRELNVNIGSYSRKLCYSYRLKWIKNDIK